MRPQSFLIEPSRLAAFLLTLGFISSAQAASYSVISEVCTYLPTQTSVAALRELASGSKAKKLIVNPVTLETSLVSASDLKCEPTKLVTDGKLAPTAYGRALQKFASPSSGQFVVANEGLKRFNPACAQTTSSASLVQPMALTLDLCPALSEHDEKHPHRPFDRELFETLRAEGQRTGRVVNATVFVSGGWIRMHRADAKLLLSMNDPARGLALTFGNHSNTHPYLGNHIPATQNFMTAMSRETFVNEVLATEKEMFKAGLTPSIYFRFPGIMSNATEIEALQDLGLVPVGTSAWLALNGGSSQYAGFDFSKDQTPKAGRILLTHGNGNEELGIRGTRGLLPYLNVKGNETNFVPLSKALSCAVE